VVPVRPSPRVAEKSGRRPSRAHPPQNRRRSESLRSRQASPLDPDAGFTVQCINADHAVNNGDRIFGYKLATSPQAGGLAVGRAVAHPVFRRSRRRWCCAGGTVFNPSFGVESVRRLSAISLRISGLTTACWTRVTPVRR
jgi:hypothetical protein